MLTSTISTLVLESLDDELEEELLDELDELDELLEELLDELVEVPGICIVQAVMHEIIRHERSTVKVFFKITSP